LGVATPASDGDLDEHGCGVYPGTSEMGTTLYVSYCHYKLLRQEALRPRQVLVRPSKRWP
jgi:hypothetical protein